jgi:hypothetical protein
VATFETRVGVDEFGSYYSGSADDPYAGPCSGPLSYWTNQNGGTPTTDCSSGDPPAPIDDATFVSDVTIPDGTHVVDGVSFVKTWRIRNSGTSTWGPGFQAIHIDGPDLSGSSFDVAASPGEELDISLTLIATGSGTQRSTWSIAHDGIPFGQSFWVEVVVDPRPSDDTDGDGVGASSGDCDDSNPAVHPGATETCNSIDDDCSGAADESLVRTCERSCGTGTETCQNGTFTPCDLWCPDDPVPAYPLSDEPDRVLTGGCSVGDRLPSPFSLLLALLLLALTKRPRPH